MKFISWNVNGLRACLKKGFEDVFNTLDADFFCIQETKMQPGQADFAPEGYTEYIYSADKKGYSGTAIWAREPALSVRYGLGRGYPQPRGPRHHAGIPGLLPREPLCAQLPERVGPHRLPYAVGG